MNDSSLRPSASAESCNEDRPTHTPGPWNTDFASEAMGVRSADGSRLCTINWLRGPFGRLGRIDPSEGEANARLIAAAPDFRQGALAFVEYEKAMKAGNDAAAMLHYAAMRQILYGAILKAEGRAEGLRDGVAGATNHTPDA
jgi:hypothetical protein